MLISRLSNRKPVLLFLSIVAIFNNVESVLCGVLFNRYHNTHDDELRKLLKQNWNSLLIGECAFSSSRLNLVFLLGYFSTSPSRSGSISVDQIPSIVFGSSFGLFSLLCFRTSSRRVFPVNSL
jgi:hypothetical protein